MEQELNQEGAVQEQPAEDSVVVSEVTPTEERATSAKQRGEEEFRKLQSMKDKAEAQAKAYEANLQTVQNELQELRNYNEQQRLEARRKELEALDDPDAKSAMKLRHQLEDRERQFNERQKRETDAMHKKWNQAIELAKQYKIDTADLLTAESPKEMELMARLKATEREKGQVKSLALGYKPDSGMSDVGGRRTFTAEGIQNMSIEEYKKYKPEIDKALREGRVK